MWFRRVARPNVSNTDETYQVFLYSAFFEWNVYVYVYVYVHVYVYIYVHVYELVYVYVYV